MWAASHQHHQITQLVNSQLHSAKPGSADELRCLGQWSIPSAVSVPCAFPALSASDTASRTVQKVEAPGLLGPVKGNPANDHDVDLWKPICLGWIWGKLLVCDLAPRAALGIHPKARTSLKITLCLASSLPFQLPPALLFFATPGSNSLRQHCTWILTAYLFLGTFTWKLVTSFFLTFATQVSLKIANYTIITILLSIKLFTRHFSEISRRYLCGCRSRNLTPLPYSAISSPFHNSQDLISIHRFQALF